MQRPHLTEGDQKNTGNGKCEDQHPLKSRKKKKEGNQNKQPNFRSLDQEKNSREDDWNVL